jgi:hypothetical protein
MDNYTRIYTDLMQRHLNRQLTEGDGYTEVEITELENRLALKLPHSMRDLYRVAGNVYNELMDFVYLVNPDYVQDIAGDDFLVFMEESQFITIVGIKIGELTNPDPEIWIFDNAYDDILLSTEVSFSEFIVRLVDDQTLMENIMENITNIADQLERNAR